MTVLFLSFMSSPAARRQNGSEIEHDAISLTSDLVEIFLTVKKGNKFVSGLSRDNFNIAEDGIPQQLVFFEKEDLTISAVLLLDTSGSMRQAMGTLQAAAVTFVQSLKERDEVAIFSFGGMVKELTPFTRDKARLAEMIGYTVADGATLLYDAIIRAIMKLQGARGRRAIILITDGADTASQLSAENVIKLSGRMAVPLFIIGAGDVFKEDRLRKTLEDLARRTGGAFFLSQTSEMRKAFSEISANLKVSYRAGYYPTRPPDDRWRRISVALSATDGQVITRQGYYAKRIRR